MFWECQYVQTFWSELHNLFISKLPHIHNLNLSEQLILFGWKDNTRTDKPFDLLLLSAKYHIYLSKLAKSLPNVHIFMKQFVLRYKLEKFVNENMSNTTYDELWRHYITIFQL